MDVLKDFGRISKG